MEIYRYVYGAEEDAAYRLLNVGRSGLFQRALQRMLVLSGELHHLIYLGFSNFVGEDAANADPLLMDVQHHSRCFFQIHTEKMLEDHHHEFHRGVIVIQQQYLVLAGFFGFDTRAGGNAKLALTIVSTIMGVIASGADRGQKRQVD